MRKKMWLLPVLIIAGLILTCLIIFLSMAANALSFSTGRFLVAENGSYLLIIDGTSPVRMSNPREKPHLFDGLDSGDEILVLHDGIQDSYPGGTGAYAIFKLSDGDISDIPETVLENLTELGLWAGVDIQPGGDIDPEDAFDVSVSSADAYNRNTLYDAALNADKLDTETIQHLPIVKLESLADLRAVAPNQTITGINAEYFEEYAVFLVYIPANSGSLRYGVDSIEHADGNLCIHVRQTNNPPAVTMDLVDWVVTVSVPKDMVKDCTSFDADLNQ